MGGWVGGVGAACLCEDTIMHYQVLSLVMLCCHGWSIVLLGLYSWPHKCRGTVSFFHVDPTIVQWLPVLPD